MNKILLEKMPPLIKEGIKEFFKSVKLHEGMTIGEVSQLCFNYLINKNLRCDFETISLIIFDIENKMGEGFEPKF